jgi:hypothetical protein
MSVMHFGLPPASYLGQGTIQERFASWKSYYKKPADGSLSRAHASGNGAQENRAAWGLLPTQISEDFAHGLVSQAEYDWALTNIPGMN